MQLDQTHIAIRERGFAEILGLGLQVTRAHAVGLAIALIVGVVPFFLFNYWLLSDWALSLWGDDYGQVISFMLVLTLLLAIEAPFATAPITLFLGQITFSQEGEVRAIAGGFLRALPQLILIQGLWRSMMLLVVMFPYWYQPYLGELILLERNPLFGSKRLTTMRRSGNLHSNSGGDLFARWLLATIAGVMLAVMFGMSAELLLAELASLEVTLSIRLLIVYHSVLWLVFGWMAVVRFLSYLDMRIRHEGWEVELLMRAEAQRLRRTMGMAGA